MPRVHSRDVGPSRPPFGCERNGHVLAPPQTAAEAERPADDPPPPSTSALDAIPGVGRRLGSRDTSAMTDTQLTAHIENLRRAVEMLSCLEPPRRVSPRRSRQIIPLEGGGQVVAVRVGS